MVKATTMAQMQLGISSTRTQGLRLIVRSLGHFAVLGTNSLLFERQQTDAGLY